MVCQGADKPAPWHTMKTGHIQNERPAVEMSKPAICVNPSGR